ncbi:Peroxiredoxin [Sporobacter termitidis DSM 10068]|uniref:Peroxiredoxin n=1 Tax=Sporobacter termitidis DSM 10068 TaxID=1123282 RepID=A0A1M5U090_9FIRM|nr:redoxin domain-containing protein [Sporobacter termitidis]SHH56452.1 Peroxiredoxin [Sporobacter termitidis DSM 10068]
MKPIEIGSLAPDFTLDDILEQGIHLADYRGKKVLLSWHPAAWTGVCTDQMRSLEVNYEKFQTLNTVPFGLSCDPSACKKAWAAVLSIGDVALLSDFWPHGKVARNYGIFIDEFGMSQRANIIIDEAGIVKWVKIYGLSEMPDIDEVLQVLATL